MRCTSQCDPVVSLTRYRIPDTSLIIAQQRELAIRNQPATARYGNRADARVRGDGDLGRHGRLDTGYDACFVFQRRASGRRYQPLTTAPGGLARVGSAFEDWDRCHLQCGRSSRIHRAESDSLAAISHGRDGGGGNPCALGGFRETADHRLGDVLVGL